MASLYQFPSLSDNATLASHHLVNTQHDAGALRTSINQFRNALIVGNHRLARVWMQNIKRRAAMMQRQIDLAEAAYDAARPEVRR